MAEYWISEESLQTRDGLITKGMPLPQGIPERVREAWRAEGKIAAELPIKSSNVVIDDAKKQLQDRLVSLEAQVKNLKAQNQSLLSKLKSASDELSRLKILRTEVKTEASEIKRNAAISEQDRKNNIIMPQTKPKSEQRKGGKRK